MQVLYYNQIMTTYTKPNHNHTLYTSLVHLSSLLCY